MFTRKHRVFVVALLIAAGAFRVAVAHWLPNDAPDDGRVYAQMARNVLEQHVYSHEAQPPYDPSLIRLPGYPLFLASIYSIFGHTNNGAVRIVQALIDTGTCGLLALLAFYWQPNEKRKRASAIAALALAAVCPFTMIYAATILTEVPTNFLVMAMFVAATIAFRQLTTEDTKENKSKNFKRSLLWWIVAGLIGGLSVLFRPDSGLFVAAVGLTLVIGAWVRSSAFRRVLSPHPSRLKAVLQTKSLSRTIVAGTVFSLAFLIVLTPWTIRNWRVFHLFQPLSPAHGEMPGEFVPRGYDLWLRTWLDDQSYVAPFLWSLDTEPIDIDDLPPYAFDSADEKNRVAALLDKYNEPPDSQSEESSPAPQASPTPAAQPSLTPNPKASGDKATPSPPVQPQKNSNANSNGNSASEEDENNNSGDESEQGDNNSAPDKSESDQQQSVEMTPEIDAAFGRLARERIARHPFRFYVWLPLKRAHTMWFDTHSQYWPFEGTLLPLEDLDYEHHQHIWLPLFAGLTALYTVLGLAGAWLLWGSGEFAARRWLLLVGLGILLRLILFSSLENPEPRYLVEFFPLLSILGGIAIAQLGARTSLSAKRAQHAQ